MKNYLICHGPLYTYGWNHPGKSPVPMVRCLLNYQFQWNFLDSKFVPKWLQHLEQCIKFKKKKKKKKRNGFTWNLHHDMYVVCMLHLYWNIFLEVCCISSWSGGSMLVVVLVSAEWFWEIPTFTTSIIFWCPIFTMGLQTFLHQMGPGGSTSF